MTFNPCPPPEPHPDPPSRAAPATPAPATFKKLLLVRVLLTPSPPRAHRASDHSRRRTPGLTPPFPQNRAPVRECRHGDGDHLWLRGVTGMRCEGTSSSSSTSARSAPRSW